MLQRFRRLDARLHSTALAIAVVAAFGAPTVAAAQGALTRPGEAMATCPTDPVGLALCLKRPVSPPPPAPPAMVGETDSSGEDSSGVESVVVTGSRIEPSSSITNNQEAGVDEGGIVKNRGDLLVILRRGRLFTVSTAGGTLRPIHAVDAFAPGVRPDADDDWYDEMLVAGDQVIVIGYSYRRGGTEINRFHLDATGRLSFRDAHHLQSSDYYSSENYASRLVGSRLVFYAPLGLDEELDGAIGLRRWQGSVQAPFRPIARARRLFVPPVLRDAPDAEIDTIHNLVSCDLLAPVFQCASVGVLGPQSRNVYVSGQAVYLWTTEAWSEDARRKGARAFLYRLPLTPGATPSVIGVRGAPTDQFSFREDPRDGVLNVLVRSKGNGEAFWRAEAAEGAVALLRLPLRSFGSGSREAPRAFYRSLPQPPEDLYRFRNRFVGDHVLYGASGSGEADDGSDGASLLVAAPIRGGAPRTFKLQQSVARLELLGRDGLVVGRRGEDTLFTAVELAPRAVPRIGDQYRLPKAAESESRSHGFFFRSETPGGADGVLALPVTRPSSPTAAAGPDAFAEPKGETAAIVFLDRRRRRFAPLGELPASATVQADDGCEVSCYDWYGEARPIFLGDRIFALLGYELVEGVVARSGVREIARVNFAPRPSAANGREAP